MEIRNDFGLPEAVYNTLAHDHYIPGDNDYSVTALLNPPQQTALLNRYYDKISIDATDNLYSVLGTAVHSLIEKYTEDEAVKEHRAYIEVGANDRVYTIGGQVDYYRAGVIRDYKVTSVNTFLYGSRFDDWTKQLNLYAFIMRKNGYPVKQLEVCMIFRDWVYNTSRQVGYPKSPIIVKPLALYSVSYIRKILNTKLSAHVYAETLSDSELAEYLPCSDKDMWRKPTVYALYKNNLKRALKLYESKKELMKWADARYYVKRYPDGKQELQRSFHIEERKGECTRCKRYCPVSEFCQQYQQMLNEQIQQEEMDSYEKNKKQIQK